MPLKKVIISGGGTGGHIFPAIAIAHALREAVPGVEILFVGAEGKMEMEKVPAAGYRIIGLDIRGFDRKNMVRNVNVLVKLLKAFGKAKTLLREFQPDVAVGVGGYASAAVMKKAGDLGIPVLIQEQNSFPGITNKRLSRFASRICVAYPGMEQFFTASKIVITGNPIRKEIENNQLSREEASARFGLNPERKTLMIFGGSQGAKAINEGVAEAVKSWLSQGIQVIWQTGKPFYAQAREIATALASGSLKVMEFIDDMPAAYAAADLVVSRAGAISIAELCASGKACILVPLPTAAEDHQTKNAMALVERDAAILMKNEDTPAQLGIAVSDLITDRTRLEKLSVNIRQMAVKESAKKIADEIIQLAK